MSRMTHASTAGREAVLEWPETFESAGLHDAPQRLHRLQRLAERFRNRLMALPGLNRSAAKGQVILLDGRRFLAIRVRPRRRAVRIDLFAGWPWPRCASVLAASTGKVVWIVDERSLRRAVDIARRTVWRWARAQARNR
ncbi:MAG: hypothetical protein AAFV29_06840 [Myxococcota bacterium]